MYNIHIVKRFRAHCGIYAIENKLLLLLFIRYSGTVVVIHSLLWDSCRHSFAIVIQLSSFIRYSGTVVVIHSL